MTLKTLWDWAPDSLSSCATVELVDTDSPVFQLGVAELDSVAFRDVVAHRTPLGLQVCTGCGRSAPPRTLCTTYTFTLRQALVLSMHDNGDPRHTRCLLSSLCLHQASPMTILMTCWVNISETKLSTMLSIQAPARSMHGTPGVRLAAGNLPSSPGSACPSPANLQHQALALNSVNEASDTASKLQGESHPTYSARVGWKPASSHTVGSAIPEHNYHHLVSLNRLGVHSSRGPAYQLLLGILSP